MSLAYLLVALPVFWIIAATIITKFGADAEDAFPPLCPVCWSITATWLVGLVTGWLEPTAIAALIGCNAWDYAKRIQRRLTKAAREKAIEEQGDAAQMPKAILYYRLIPLATAILVASIALSLQR